MWRRCHEVTRLELDGRRLLDDPEVVAFAGFLDEGRRGVQPLEVHRVRRTEQPNLRGIDDADGRHGGDEARAVRLDDGRAR